MDVISTVDVPAGERFGFWSEINAKLRVPDDLRCERELHLARRMAELSPSDTARLTTRTFDGPPRRHAPDPGCDRGGASHLAAIPAQAVPAGGAHP